MTYAAAVALLMLIGLAAAALPAWRASRVEPMTGSARGLKDELLVA